MRDPRGPQVATALSFNPPTAYVREMADDELYDTLQNWKLWDSKHGRGRGEEATMFRAEAKTQKGRLRRELLRRGLPVNRPLDKCAFCHSLIPNPLDIRIASIDDKPVTLCVACFDDGPYVPSDGIPPREV